MNIVKITKRVIQKFSKMPLLFCHCVERWVSIAAAGILLFNDTGAIAADQVVLKCRILQSISVEGYRLCMKLVNFQSR